MKKKRSVKPKVNKRYAKFGKIAKPQMCKWCGALMRSLKLDAGKRGWVCDACGQEQMNELIEKYRKLMFGTGSPKSKLIPVKLDQRVIELARSKTFDEDVGIWQRLWQDKSIRRLMLVMAGLLLLIVVAIVMSAGGDDEVVNERVDVVQPAVVQEAQTVATDVDGVVADGLGGVGQFIARWMDLIVLLIVLMFITTVFHKLGGSFR